MRNIFRLYVKDGHLYNNKGLVRYITIPTVTRLGKQSSTELIKQMKSNPYIYEARIKESKYDHPRMLFFPYDNSLLVDDITVPSAIFTFFFVKVNDGTKDTQTQSLIDATGSVRQQYFIDQFSKEVIGRSIT